MLNALSWLLGGVVVSALLTVWAIKRFPKLKLLDFPDRYPHEQGRDPLPYPGGLVFAVLAMGLVMIDPGFGPILIPVGITLVLNFLDDRVGLPALHRLVTQILIASMVYFVGIQIDFIGNPLAATNWELGMYPFASYVVTVIWIVAIQNAINFFDGVSGSAIGVGGIGFLALAALGYLRPELFFDPGHMSLTLGNLYLGGLCVGGFLFFFRKQLIFGDTGAQTLGLLLAIMSIWAGAKLATTLLVLAVPVLDVVIVSLRRIFIEKKAPWKGDTKHFHHNLARKYGERRAVLFLLIISAVLGGIAVFTFAMTKLWALVLCLVLLTIWNVVLMRKISKKV